jgi:hypothetical protein
MGIRPLRRTSPHHTRGVGFRFLLEQIEQYLGPLGVDSERVLDR